MLFQKKKTKEKTVCAVIVAAGTSSRMGGQNKLLAELCGRPVLAYTLRAFEENAGIDAIVLVCREADILPYRALADTYGITKLHTIVRGGENRSASVLAGISACPMDTAFVAIHDGARPLVDNAVIDDAIIGARAYGAAAPVVAIKDSIKRLEGDRIAADVPRDTIAAVQTPQVFPLPLIQNALQDALRANRTLTDDCAAVESLGVSVHASRGSYRNLKITTPEDLRMAEALLMEDTE